MTRKERLRDMRGYETRHEGDGESRARESVVESEKRVKTRLATVVASREKASKTD